MNKKDTSMASRIQVLVCFALLATAAAELDILAEAGGAVQAAAASTDEARALDVKNAEFWQPLEDAASAAKSEPHASLLQEAEVELARLPAENAFVREALAEAVDSLRHADEDLAAQASESSDAASEHLASNHQDAVILEEGRSWGAGVLSLFTGERSLFAQVIQRLSGMGYAAKVHEDVEERQQAILPSLRGSLRGSRSSGVLHESHIASSRSFDILRYGIYNQSAPKTPKAVEAIVNKIVDASADTRHRYMQLTMRSVSGITHDVETEGEGAQATVSRSLQGEEATPGEDLDVELRRPGGGMAAVLLLLLLVAVAFAAVLFGAATWARARRHAVGRPLPAELWGAAITFGLFLGVAAGALFLDAVGLLHRAAFAGALGLGAAGLAARCLYTRLAPLLSTRRKLATL